MDLPWRLLAVLHLDRKEEHKLWTPKKKKSKNTNGSVDIIIITGRSIESLLGEAKQYLCYCKKWTKSVTVREQDRKELDRIAVCGLERWKYPNAQYLICYHSNNKYTFEHRSILLLCKVVKGEYEWKCV